MKINESISRPDFGGFREVKFRGDVKLKLIDPKTNKVVKTVEGQNMQTNAISLIMSTNYYGMVNYEDLRPIAKTLCGGVLAFHQTLTESADNIYPPTSNLNNVVAHAGQTTYSSASADNTRGNPNDDPTLTGPIANGYKLVWDFPATQGNGTISAIALTHKDTGDYWLRGGSSYKPFAYKAANATTGLQRCLPQIYNNSRREAYRIEGSGTALNIQTISDYGIIKDLGIAQRPLSSVETSSVLVSSHEYTMPQNYGKMRYLYLESSNELHCLYFYTDGSDGKISRVKINLTSNTSTTDTITVSGKKLLTPNQVDSYRIPFYTLDANGFLYMINNDRTKVIAVYYSNVSSDSTREISIGSTVETGAADCMLGFGNHCYSPYGGFMVDGNQCKTVGSDYPTGLAYGVTSFYNKNSSPMFWSPYYNFQSGSWMAYSLNKFYLATVKNLSEPIIKSAAYAMQIEYTLTEVSE